MKGVVLAAGRGTRLLPLTEHVAKALLPVKGRPIIGLVLEGLATLAPGEVIVVVGHRGEQLMEYLGDGSGHGVKVTYREQAALEGTAKALGLALEGVEEDAVVSACDCLVPKSHLQELWRYHVREGCEATLSLKVLDARSIMESSSVRLEEDGSISGIVEKPGDGEILSNIASSPVYVFSEAVKEYLPRVARSTRGEYEVQDALQRMIEDGLRVKGIISESWIHLSDVEDFMMVNFQYMKRWLERF